MYSEEPDELEALHESGWYNWYSDKQTVVYRRWSAFDLALSSWVRGLVKPLKKQLEASRFCEHTVIDPTPHHRFLRLAETRDILRPNIALNLEGLGEYADRVSQDWPVKFPVMVFQVACRETLEATRDDIWRYLWLSDGCRVGIIFIVNSLYDQHLKPFKLSMEIWSKQPIEQECPYSLDDCPPPPNLHKLSQAGEDKEDAEV
ncbi:unnamed protein product [Rhizoctonia solani]|uniref:Uncharacterized protein n=1 Tax=Rhizoctonia solani TaxID=456999 RepID=A0A8H3DLC8_9AGAM|nr:unnamed protein product [Rhizoctonia solani]